MMVENLTLWTVASLTKYLLEQPFGIPVVILQQNVNVPAGDRIEVLIEHNFSKNGTRNEHYGTVKLKVMMYTKNVPTDIYYHTRIKARINEALSKNIKILRMGFEGCDKLLMGYLKPLPTESLKITATSIEEPNGSLIEQSYTIALC